MFVSNPSKISSQVSVLNLDLNSSTVKLLMFLTKHDANVCIGAM